MQCLFWKNFFLKEKIIHYYGIIDYDITVDYGAIVHYHNIVYFCIIVYDAVVYYDVSMIASDYDIIVKTFYRDLFKEIFF